MIKHYKVPFTGNLVLGIIGFCLSVVPLGSQAQIYQNVAPELGISQTYGYGSFGGGLSFFDFDQDGWDDLTFATQDGHELAFYRNVEGQFEKIDPPYVVNSCEVKQVLWADIENDGDQDLFVTCHYGNNSLYINDGDFGFTETIFPAPDTFSTAPTWGAAIGDYDVDGFLDIFVCNKTQTLPIPNQLFRNLGDGTFEDVTEQYFIQDIFQATFCASFVDVNNDLLPDLYTAEDKIGVNQMYKNTGSGQFEDVTDDCGAGVIMDAMCVAAGDFDNDDDFDIYVTNTPGGNALFRNNGNETFSDIAPTSGTGYYMVGWGSNWLDYDNDRDLDLYVSGSTPVNPLPSILYINFGNNFFIPGVGSGFVGDTTFSFSNAIGDFNRDGFVDIAISNMDPDSNQVWMNSGNQNNWLTLSVEGTVSNRDGIGVLMEVYSNELKQIRYTNCGVGYLAQNSEREIFGLGFESMADSVIVKWPSGIIDRLEEVSANQFLHVVEGSTLTTSNIHIETSQFNIVPNPASSIFSVSGLKSEQGILKISDTSGKVIKELRYHDLEDTRFEIEDLIGGVYLVLIETSKGIFTSRLLKLY
ncbi:MAG: CRTAC1 family protein [Bacteroidota bacterium]